MTISYYPLNFYKIQHNYIDEIKYYNIRVIFKFFIGKPPSVSQFIITQIVLYDRSSINFDLITLISDDDIEDLLEKV